MQEQEPMMTLSFPWQWPSLWGESYEVRAVKGKRYFVGVSLGQYNQWTSFVIIEQIEAGEEFIYHIGQAERFPLKTSYPEIAKRVKSVWDNLKEHAGFHNDRYIVMDITGVGESIVKIIEKQDLTIDSKVTITNGTIASRNEKIHKKWNVPKKDLVSALQAVFHTDRIIIAKGISDEKIIVQELQDFRIDKISLKKTLLPLKNPGERGIMMTMCMLWQWLYGRLRRAITVSWQ